MKVNKEILSTIMLLIAIIISLWLIIFAIYSLKNEEIFIPEPIYITDTIVVHTINCSKEVTITTYQPVPNQCDDTPYITADGSDIRNKDYYTWCAVSRDLMYYYLNFGDTITLLVYNEDTSCFYIDAIVHDLTNIRLKNTVDILDTDNNFKHKGIINLIRR